MTVVNFHECTASIHGKIETSGFPSDMFLQAIFNAVKINWFTLFKLSGKKLSLYTV